MEKVRKIMSLLIVVLVILASLYFYQGSMLSEGTELDPDVEETSDDVAVVGQGSTSTVLVYNNYTTDDFNYSGYDNDLNTTGDVTFNSVSGDGSGLTGMSGTGGHNLSWIRNSNNNSWVPTDTNLQLAVWDLNSSGGGTVWLPNNETLVTTTIIWENDADFIGVGSSSKLKLDSGADCDILSIASKNNILIENICFDFDNASQSAPMGGYENCIDITGTSKNITIRGCRLINGVGSLIDIQEGTSDVLIDSCIFNNIEVNSGVYPAGVWLAGSHCTVQNSYFEDCYGSGIVIEAGSGLKPSNNHTIDGNRITGRTSHGIHMEWNGTTDALKSENCLIINNIIWDCNSTAYTVANDYGIGILVSEGSICRNNRITNAPKYAIEVCGNDTKIIENYIDTIQVYSGIYVTNQWYYSTTEIKDNIIERTNGKGIHVADKTQVAHIIGNIIRETGDAAIYCGAEESFINDNDLIDIPDVGIEMISPNRNLTASHNYFNNIDGSYAIYCIAPSTIDDNTFYDIALHVIYLLGNENIVNNNRITYWGHAGNGDGINVHNSRNNTINNNIMKNGGSGGHSDGIELDDCFNSTLSGNNIRNTDDGIEETGTSNGNIIMINIAEVIVTGGSTIDEHNLAP